MGRSLPRPGLTLLLALIAALIVGCGGGGGGGGGGGAGGGGEDDEFYCRASGLGRTYKLWYECGMGDYSESNDFYTGSEEYNIDGTTYVSFTDSHVTPGETEEFPNVAGHIVTNWRQD